MPPPEMSRQLANISCKGCLEHPRTLPAISVLLRNSCLLHCCTILATKCGDISSQVAQLTLGMNLLLLLLLPRNNLQLPDIVAGVSNLVDNSMHGSKAKPS